MASSNKNEYKQIPTVDDNYTYKQKIEELEELMRKYVEKQSDEGGYDKESILDHELAFYR